MSNALTNSKLIFSGSTDIVAVEKVLPRNKNAQHENSRILKDLIKYKI
jgi:hypothetical protein